MGINLLVIIKQESTKRLFGYSDFFEKLSDKTVKKIIIEDFEDTITLSNIEMLQEKYSVDNFRDYILITDSLIIGLGSYRLFHYDFKDIVLFYNPEFIEDFKNYPKNQISFFEKVVNLNDIQSESLPKKLYVNLNKYNYKNLCTLESLMNHLCPIELYEFKNTAAIMPVNKLYCLSETENFFIDNGSDYNEEIRLYELIEDSNIDHIFKEKHQCIVNSYYLMYYILNNKMSRVRSFQGQISSATVEKNKELFIKNFFHLLNEIPGEPKFKLQVANIFLKIKCNHDLILDYILEYLIDGKLEKKYLKSIYTYLVIGYFRKEFLFSDRIYRELRKIHNLYVEYIRTKVNLKDKLLTKPNEDSKTIVILIDQLLTEFHAPTNVLVGTLGKLLEKTDYRFLLIVEDNFITAHGEFFPALSIKVISSHSLFNKHKNLFDANRVEIVYASSEKDGVSKSKELINQIQNVNPEIILSLSSHSIIQNILYEEYPIINISLGYEMLVNKAHIYLYKNAKRAIELEKMMGTINLENIFDFTYDSQIIQSTKNYKKSDFGYQEQDFVIITSGNRIYTEIDTELIDLMKELLSSYSNMKWLLVGSTLPKYLLHTYPKEILKQVKHIPFEEDLIALNKICDISINPKRIGGGHSVWSCITAGIPVIMCEFESDGLVFIGRENTFGKDYKDIISEVIKCYENPKYKKLLASKQNEFLKKLANKDRTQELIEYMEKAKIIKQKVEY